MINFIIVLLVISVIPLAYWYGYTPLSKKEKADVLELGIKHYTTAENAEKIMQSREIFGRSDKRAFFFLNVQIPQKSLVYNKHCEWEVVIVINNITAEQLKKIKLQRHNKAVCYKGDFKFLPENIITLSTVN